MGVSWEDFLPNFSLSLACCANDQEWCRGQVFSRSHIGCFCEISNFPQPKIRSNTMNFVDSWNHCTPSYYSSTHTLIPSYRSSQQHDLIFFAYFYQSFTHIVQSHIPLILLYHSFILSHISFIYSYHSFTHTLHSHRALIHSYTSISHSNHSLITLNNLHISITQITHSLVKLI